MSDIYYKQCVLKKNDKMVQICWIPERFAHLGNVLKLRSKKDKSEWDDGWVVVNDCKTAIRLEHDILLEYEMDHKHQRKASDI
jgi:hypothetical protein